MAFSGSSYIAGIGTTLAAIAFGVACGSMVTTSVVQPPNRLERLKSGTTVGSNSGPTHQVAPSVAEKSDPAKHAAQDAPLPAVAATSVAATGDPQPPQQPQPAAAGVAKADVKSAAVTSGRPQSPSASAPGKPASAAPAPVAKSEDTAAAKEDTAAARTDHATTRAADPNREIPHRRTQRKSSDDRRFSERKRRQDEDPRQQDLDAAANVVRQMPRGTTVGQVVERDDSPRFARSRHFEMFDDDGPPRVVSEPPPRFFGLFGD